MKLLTIVTYVICLSTITLLGCSDDGVDEEVPSVQQVVTAHSDYYHYESVDELTEWADLIIEGQVVNSTVQKIETIRPLDDDGLDNPQLNPHPEGLQPDDQPVDIFTVAEVEVHRVYKGDAEENDIV